MYDVEDLKGHMGGALSKLFSRHFVSLIAMGRWPNGNVLKVSYSAFVFRVGEDWHMATAGHNIEGLKDAVRNGSLHSLTWQLADSFAGGAHRGTLPLDLKLDDWVSAYDEYEPAGIDLAIASIHRFHTLALAKNGVVPLDMGADFIRLSGRPCDQLLIVGVPSERSSLDGGRAEQGLYAIPAAGLPDDAVIPILKGPYARHYGVVPEEALASVDVTSIVGMSGGPVFGLWFSDDKMQFDYGAIGIQSGWDKGSRQIAAWPLDRMAQAIANEMKRSS